MWRSRLLHSNLRYLCVLQHSQTIAGVTIAAADALGFITAAATMSVCIIYFDGVTAANATAILGLLLALLLALLLTLLHSLLLSLVLALVHALLLTLLLTLLLALLLLSLLLALLLLAFLHHLPSSPLPSSPLSLIGRLIVATAVPAAATTHPRSCAAGSHRRRCQRRP